MQKSEKFFIFSWKELVVIALLFLTSVGFFFTLGLHYGKKLHVETPAPEVAGSNLEESPESVPSRETLSEAEEKTPPAAEAAIKTETQNAVEETNLKVEHAKPVDLPAEKKKTAEAKPKTEEKLKSTVVSESRSESHPAGRFAVQLGSYPSRKEAQSRITILSKRGLKPEIRIAVVNEETRFRVVLPGFQTKAQADVRAKDLKAKHKIENFVVIKSE